MNNDIKAIIKYMNQYVKNKYEHDSEPMLNWKDIKTILDYITNLQIRIDKVISFIDIYTDGINLEAFDCLKLMYKIKDILKGE